MAETVIKDVRRHRELYIGPVSKALSHNLLGSAMQLYLSLGILFVFMTCGAGAVSPRGEPAETVCLLYISHCLHLI